MEEQSPEINRADSRNDEKYGERPIRVESGFLAKLDNFWYHHKWKVIAIAFLLTVTIIVVVQAASNETEDVVVVYCGSNYLSGNEVEELRLVLNALMPEDYNGNGSKFTGFAQYQVYSAAEIESIQAETDEDGVHGFVNTSFNSTSYNNYYTYLQTGESAILILSPWLYEDLRKAERLKPISELFDTLPEATDEAGYGIALSELEVYKHYNAFRKLPSDAVICFLKPYVFGNTSKEDLYRQMQEMLRAIVNFKPENGKESESVAP